MISLMNPMNSWKMSPNLMSPNLMYPLMKSQILMNPNTLRLSGQPDRGSRRRSQDEPRRRQMPTESWRYCTTLSFGAAASVAGAGAAGWRLIQATTPKPANPTPISTNRKTRASILRHRPDRVMRVATAMAQP